MQWAPLCPTKPLVIKTKIHFGMEFPSQLSHREDLDNRCNECWKLNCILCWRVANAIKSKGSKVVKEDQGVVRGFEVAMK